MIERKISSQLIGREAEIGILKEALEKAKNGAGSNILISGEPGIGKTRLVDEFSKHAVVAGTRILRGEALHGTVSPFYIFSKALAEVNAVPLFEEQEYSGFMEMFALDRDGALLGKASSEMHAGMLADMLSAVQEFVRDSFGNENGEGASLGRLEYGVMKILIEHGRGILLAGVVEGAEHPGMRTVLKQTLNDIENAENDSTGKAIAHAASAKFLVRKDLEGLKLDNERVRIADRVLKTLTGVSGGEPIVLVLEDLHWADDSSLFIYNYLARNVRNNSVVILGTARTAEGASFTATLSKMRKENIIAEIDLKKLDSQSIALIVESVCPANAFPQSFIDALDERCGGNPLFVSELLKHMTQEGNIALKNGIHSLSTETFTVPNSVEEVIKDRLSGLSPDALAMAEYASCIGKEFKNDIALSVGMVMDTSIALEELQRSGITLDRGVLSQFCHAVYQDIIYSSISPRWRAAHHKRIGEHLEAASAGSVDAVVYELARHFSLTNEHRKAFDYLVKAGQMAESAYAFEQTVQLYEKAIETSSKVHDIAGLPEIVMDLTERLGDVYRLNRYDKALDIYAHVQTNAQDMKVKARLSWKRSSVFEKMGNFEAALAEVTVGRRFVGTDSLEYRYLDLSEAWTRMRHGEFDAAIALSETAVEHFNELGNLPKELGKGYEILGGCYWYKGELARAIEYYEKSLGFREQTDDLRGLAATYNSLGIIRDDMGETDRALDYYEKSLKLCEKIGEQNGVATLYNNMAIILRARGDLERVFEFHRRSLGIRQKLGNRDGIAASQNNLGIVFKDTGELDKAHGSLLESLAIFEDIGNKRGAVAVYVSLGDTMLEWGKYSEAEVWYSKCIGLSRELGLRNYLAETLIGMAETHIAGGRFSEAVVACDEADIVSEGIGMKLNQAACLRLRGMLLGNSKSWDEAEEKFDASVKAFTELRAEPEAAKTQYRWAMMLLEKGEKGRALAMLGEAITVFEKRGLRLWANRCDKAMGR